MILKHLGNEAEAYYIDTAYGLLIVAKGREHYTFRPELKRFMRVEAIAQEKLRWAQITEAEARERLTLNGYTVEG